MGSTYSPEENSRLDSPVDFWDAFDRLVASSRVIINRPKGTPHPGYADMIYPLDYGYLEATESKDGDGIDVWVGSQASRRLEGAIFTVDLKKRDSEVKLLLGCTEAEIQTILTFLNDESMRAIAVRRDGDGRNLLRTRRSVRRFSSSQIAPEVLEKVLEAATWAPSAHNRQPWRFAVLTSPEAKTVLANSMGADFRRDLLADGLSEAEADAQVARSRQRILEAPVDILMCMDMQVGDVYPDPRRQRAEYLMGVQGVAMAGENLLLAAHAEGLGGVWVCAPLFVQETVRQALKLPGTWQPQGLLMLGYPAKIPRMRPRRPVVELTRYL